MAGGITHSPANVVRKLLIDLGIGVAANVSGSQSAWVVTANLIVPEPDNVLCVMDTAPVQEGRLMIDGDIVQKEGIQVLLRGSDHDTGWTKINAIRNAFNRDVRQTNVTLSSSLYLVESIDIVNGPLDAGKETPTSKRHMFSLNAFATIRQTT